MPGGTEDGRRQWQTNYRWRGETLSLMNEQSKGAQSYEIKCNGYDEDGTECYRAPLTGCCRKALLVSAWKWPSFELLLLLSYGRFTRMAMWDECLLWLKNHYANVYELFSYRSKDLLGWSLPSSSLSVSGFCFCGCHWNFKRFLSEGSEVVLSQPWFIWALLHHSFSACRTTDGSVSPPTVQEPHSHLCP